MSQIDNLEQLWQTQAVRADMKGEEMRRIIIQKMSKFDRTIRRRNQREIIASLVGALAFGWIAWGQVSWLSRLGSIVILASYAWIIFYFLRYGSGPADPDPDQDAAGFQRALMAKIDHQIRLVRSAKYWCLLPLYMGLLLLSAGDVQAHAAAGTPSPQDAISPLVCTLVFALIWWANDVYAAGKLRQWRARLESGDHGGGFEC